MADHETNGDNPSGSWKLSAILIVAILAAAGGLAFYIFSSEPTAERGGATRKTAMLVEVVEVERGDWRPKIVATGTVQPARDIVLRPQVGGRITALADGFVPGGFVEEGEVLMRIEAADYRHALAQRKGDLREALAALAVEQGRSDAAQAEYDYLDEDLPPEDAALILRKPQLEAARERVAAARAAVEQAELNVRRTTVEAPFDAHVLRRDVNVGSQVSPTEDLGRLVGVETYWVVVDLPLSKLRWVTVADDGQDGSPVEVRNRQAWPPQTVRKGHLFRLVGALDETTRMARVLAAVPDPLARAEDAGDKPALMVGEFVEATIAGKEIADVVRLARDLVRDKDTVWTMVDGKLQVNDVEVVMRDAEYAYISEGLDDGARVVTTNLATVTQGAPLRVEGEPGGDAANEQAPEAQGDAGE